MEFLIHLAADGLLIVIVVAGGLCLMKGISHKRILIEYPYAILAGMTSLLIAKLMSLIYQPAIARPFLELGVSPGAFYIDNPGFPSDHALLATVVVLAVYALTSYRKVAYILAGLVLLMGMARIAALVHTPLDVFGGIGAAAVGGLWYVARAKNMSR